MKRWFTCLVLAMAMCFFMPLALQADETADLSKQLDTMQQRLEALEQKEDEPFEFGGDIFEEIVKAVEFHGALDLTYMDWEEDGPSGGDSTFDVYELYLAAHAEIGEHVTVYFEPRYEHAGDSIELRQGYMDWKIAEPITARFGKFYMPIGIFRNAYYASLRNLVSYPYSMRLINVTPWADVGAELYGEIPLTGDSMKIKYEVAVLNGLNEDYTQDASDKVRHARQNRDNNSNKTMGGRIGFVPIEDLEIGFSYNTGKYDDDANYELKFIGADMAFSFKDLTLRAEWVESEAETTEGDVETKGGYANLGYKFLKDTRAFDYVEGVLGYDYVDPGQGLKDRFFIAEDQKVRATSVGLRTRLYDHFFIKAEYRFTDEDDPELDNDGFFAQVVVAF